MLQAKLHTPAIGKNLICREKLLQRLRVVPEHKLTLVTAPAGYGKTTLVMQWLEQCSLPSAWLSLDVKDNSPGVFWRYVCMALDSIVNGVSKATDYTFTSQDMLKANVHLNILIDKLAQAESDFILAVDDLHYITDPAVLDGLSYLIDYLPAKMHLVLISRSSPDINLARLRFKWQIPHLEEKDLRFGEEDIFRFYQARGINLVAGAVKKVKSYTEGWVTALVAVAMTIEDHEGNRDVIAGLEGCVNDIEQYFNNEVLSVWSDEKKDFAVKTSILDNLTADICNALTGKNNAQRLLTEICDSNGFLIAVDAQKHTFRYHLLFRGFLQKLLHQTMPDEVPSLHAKAGLRYKEQNRITEAIEHFLDGGLYEEAFELIEHHLDNLIRKREFDTILPWVERLPEAVKNKSLKIAAMYTLYYAETNQLPLSRQWLDKTKALREESQHNSDPGRDDYSRTLCAFAEVSLLLREGDVRFVSLLFAAAQNNTYKIPDYHDFNMADVYFFRCPINILTKLFGQMPEKYARMIESYRGMITKNPGYAPLAVGEYFYEINRLDDALPNLLKAMEEAQAAGCTGSLVPVMVDLARIRRSRGDLQGALDMLTECERTLRSVGKTHWIYSINAYRCMLYADMGNLAGIDEWFATVKLDKFTQPSKIREFELIVYARVLMLKDRLEDSRLLLQRLLTFAKSNGRYHSMAEILILLALLHIKENDVPKSMEYLESALAIGMKEGYVRSFLDECAPMLKLLNCYTSHKKRQTENPDTEALIAYVKTLKKQMRAFVKNTRHSHDITVAEIMKEHLTAQEMKVLSLLFEAKTNREIGFSLNITPATVKTHVSNIYSKLGVQTRAQCIKLIQETGLLK